MYLQTHIIVTLWVLALEERVHQSGVRLCDEQVTMLKAFRVVKAATIKQT